MSQTPLERAFLLTRQSGSTDWILKSCLKNPKVIVVCLDVKALKVIDARYLNMLVSQPWWKKLKDRIFMKHYPTFTTMYDVCFTDFMRGRRDLPVIFDNSCLIRIERYGGISI